MTAPALFDPSLGTVHVWSKDGKIPAALADLIDGNVARIGHRHTDDTGVAATHEARREFVPSAIPRFYVTAGSVDRSASVSANLVGAVHGVICLPTKRDPGAGQWLREQIARRVNAGLTVIICVRGGAW